jgi:putative transposase
MVERVRSQRSLKEQADLLSISRSSLYYAPRPPSAREVALKHGIDALYTDCPFFGARRIAHTLREEGVAIGRKTVRAYRQEMGLEAVYPKPNLSRPAPDHRVYPSLLRGVQSACPNHIGSPALTKSVLQREATPSVAGLSNPCRSLLRHRTKHL